MLLILLGIGIWIVIRFVLGGPEDTWICEKGNWIKHGNPQASMPTTECK